jgi:hypothetical protein
VHQFGSPARGPFGEVMFLYQKDLKSAGSGF